MKKVFGVLPFTSFIVSAILFNLSPVFAQVNLQGPDAALKGQIYERNKRAVMNYSLKDFDKLFFEYNSIKVADTLLTKEAFYNYTIKIGTFSDRLAKLYPEEKELAEQSKQQWFRESYEDYLRSKVTQK